jgi:hypothetical protein
MTKSRHITIQNYKKRYEEILAKLDDKTWEEYWEVMIRNYEWVDYVFIQSAAWYLGHDIIIVATTSTEQTPFITISGNMTDENIPCPGIALTIGSKSSVHYQSLLPLEIRVTKTQIKPRIPENTINLAATKVNDHSDLNTNSREEFPDLSPPKEKRTVQPEARSSRMGMQNSSRPSVPNDLNSNKMHNHKNPTQKVIPTNITDKPEEEEETISFKYKENGKTLSFEIVSDKRVKCPKCRRDFKNILRHLQQSGCKVNNIEDLGMNFKKFKIKDDQRRWKAKSIAKQRAENGQKVKDSQNERNAKFIAKQRAVNDQKVKEGQNERKAKSLAKQMSLDDQKVKEGQNERYSKFIAKKRAVNDQKVKEGQNERYSKFIAKQRAVDDQKVKDDQNERKAKSFAKQMSLDDQKVKDDQNERKSKSIAKQRAADDQKV